jgi:ABC-type branched-subunit amino acid transport system substrate-binding protein
MTLTTVTLNNSTTVTGLVGNGTLVVNGTTIAATNTELEGVVSVSAVANNTATSNLTTSEEAVPMNVTSFDIGALIPLTEFGEASTDGILLAESFKCSLSFANNNRGILPNIFLTFSIQNTNDDINLAMNQALLLQRRGTFAVVGPQNDDQVLPVMNAFNTYTTPLVAYQAGDSQFNNGTVYASLLRTWPSDSAQAQAMADTFSLLGWTFISTLYTNDEYGQSGRTALSQALSSRRIKVTCLNVITPNATQGLVNFSNCLSTSDANVVVLWSMSMSHSIVHLI